MSTYSVGVVIGKTIRYALAMGFAAAVYSASGSPLPAAKPVAKVAVHHVAKHHAKRHRIKARHNCHCHCNKSLTGKPA